MQVTTSITVIFSPGSSDGPLLGWKREVFQGDILSEARNGLLASWISAKD